MKLSQTTSTAILKLFKYRINIDKYGKLLQQKKINEDVKRIISLFSEYFRENETKSFIDTKLFTLWADTNNKFNNTDFRYTTLEFLEELDDLTTEEETIIINRLNDELRASEVKIILEDFYEGNIGKLQEELRVQVDLFETNILTGDINKVTTSALDLFKKDIYKTGLKWSLPSLNRCMTPLQPGDFGIIAARPDSGKTSFIASQVVHFAHQTKRPILWLNNEGMNDKIKQRCIQSALNKSVSEIISMIEEGVDDIDALYYEHTEGGDDKIQIVGIHNKTSAYIEHLIEHIKPSVVIFDMIDNVKFIGQQNTGAVRTDQILEGMYQWARNLAVVHECVTIATSQVSSPGEGMKFPTMDMLKDSKTGKQGACDFILMIGRENTGNSSSRYLSLPKNKLAVSGQPIDPRKEVYFDYSKSRYYEEDFSAVNLEHIDFEEIEF